MNKFVIAIALPVALPAVATAQVASAPAAKMDCCKDKAAGAKADCCKGMKDHAAMSGMAGMAKMDCCKDMASMQGMPAGHGMKQMPQSQPDQHQVVPH